MTTPPDSTTPCPLSSRQRLLISTIPRLKYHQNTNQVLPHLLKGLIWYQTHLSTILIKEKQLRVISTGNKLLSLVTRLVHPVSVCYRTVTEDKILELLASSVSEREHTNTGG